MNPLRKLGWTLLLTSWLAGGCVPQGDAAAPARPGKGPEGAPGAAGAAPAAQPAASPALAVTVGAEAPPPAWPWLMEEEDEFEGDGWSFWPLGGH